METTNLDVQQARIKQILFKSQLRSVLYGVREPTEALFSSRENVLGQWLTTVLRPQHGTRPELREAERLLTQMLNVARELVTQYQRGQIEESRRGMSQIDAYAEQLLQQLERLSA
ncbi:hypothetical protein HMJ29_01280 [Hymenobacter taeanensis]|uniref:Uncharacterized protein n=1 Tax=Hymenobacter taeanensis TaxID=2735321 RepID=A0A6M6BCB5_9BACT|nr:MULTISPECIES: hypothetical protein [Hymenobacter]QJX45639.1 hypothetical protein HMJ29_01280 [Hymenobacter taeanensis]UOQ79475.1 hypothetical protein MUN83_11465 [Hymenobacter sp. 5414T-23]